MVEVTRTSSVEPATATDPQTRQHHPEDESGPGGEEEARRRWRSAHQIQDVAQIMGIPASELTPRVEEALSIIVGEFDHTRSELERERERVRYFQELSDRDSVLPVANKRALMRDLGRLINRATHTRTVSSLVVFTIQGLERVRASKGLAEAETILAKVSATLSSGLRGSDMLAYLGSADFGVILTLSAGRQAEDKVGDLSTRIAGTLQVISGDGWRVGWGIAPFQAGDDPDAIFEKADADLRRRAS